MATLTIRNLPEEVRERLRIRAARNGRSMEAEVRTILCQSSFEDADQRSFDALQRWVSDLYGKRKPANVVDDLLAERRQEADKES